MRRLLPHPTRPSPFLSRVGIRDITFEACSGFTRVTAHWLAQPPKAAFVARLRPVRLPETSRLPATRSIDNSLGGTYLHWCYAPSGRTEKAGLARRTSSGRRDDRTRAGRPKPANGALRSDTYACQLFLFGNQQAAAGVAGLPDSSKHNMRGCDADQGAGWQAWALRPAKRAVSAL